MKRISVALAILIWCLAISSKAADSVPSPYAGEESRAVKSLSAEDVAELRRGRRHHRHARAHRVNPDGAPGHRAQRPAPGRPAVLLGAV